MQCAVDEDLVKLAVEVGGNQSVEAVVAQALHDYVRLRSEYPILSSFGQIEYDDDYDYKAFRRESSTV